MNEENGEELRMMTDEEIIKEAVKEGKEMIREEVRRIMKNVIMRVSEEMVREIREEAMRIEAKRG